MTSTNSDAPQHHARSARAAAAATAGRAARRLTGLLGPGRGRPVAVLIAALVGTGLAGILAIPALSHGAHPRPAGTVADASLNQRAARTDRADRANRPAATASASPSAGTTAPDPAAASPSPGTAAPSRSAAPDWVAPMAQYTITSCYGYRTVPYAQFHQGIDFANAQGTPERAAAAGTVIMAGNVGDGYGNKVVIQHGPSLYTLYGHAERLLVSVGQHVSAGQVISLEGATGDVTGPHLHFEVWTALWQRIDPAPFLRARGVPVAGC